MLKNYLKFFLLFIFYILSYNSFSQFSKKLDPNKLDHKLIHTLFLNLLNEHRDSLGIGKLKDNYKLDLAAKCQSDYMAAFLKVTHNQPDIEKKNPGKRVELFNGNFAGVGENCLYVPLSTSFKIKENLYEIKTYNDLATCMFLSWRHSPGHYKNMISPEFHWSGFQSTFEQKSKRIYAANVFGGFEYIPPKIFPSTFSIGDLKHDFGPAYRLYANKLFSRSAVNFIYRSFQNIMLYHYNIREVKSIIKDSKDGIMIDYVLREQFVCDGDNNLNNSPIYDGWPQNPIYSKEFFANNMPTNKVNVNTKIATIPLEIHEKHYQSNVIIIKNNTAINYTIPITVMHQDFRVLNFKPIIDTTGISLIDTIFTIKIENKIYFNKATAIPVESDNKVENLLEEEYLPNDTKINNIHITGYSSIEGDSLLNTQLQIKRANYLKDKFARKTNLDTSLIKIAASENRVDFIKDFGQFFNYNDSLSVSDLRKIYHTNKNEISENILSHHRYTEIKFDLEIPLNLNSSLKSLKFIHDNSSSLNNHAKLDLLKIILQKLQNASNIFEISANVFDSVNDPGQLLPLYFYTSDSANFRKVYLEHRKKKNWNKNDNYNFIIANFRYYQSYNKPFIPFNELTNYFSSLNSPTVSEKVFNLLWLNFYLIKSHYSQDTRNEKELSISLDKFKKIYFSFDPKIEDIIDIGLFFNYFNHFDWTLELLKTKLDQFQDNEELWFTYLSTYTFASYPNYDELFMDKLMKTCFRHNKFRFCSWINDENFQLLRVPMVKKMFCNDCTIH